jgi:hypothetical protein
MELYCKRKSHKEGRDYSASSNWHPYFVSNNYDSKGFLTQVHGFDTNGLTTVKLYKPVP